MTILSGKKKKSVDFTFEALSSKQLLNNVSSLSTNTLRIDIGLKENCIVSRRCELENRRHARREYILGEAPNIWLPRDSRITCTDKVCKKNMEVIKLQNSENCSEILCTDFFYFRTWERDCFLNFLNVYIWKMGHRAVCNSDFDTLSNNKTRKKNTIAK